ncbi:MAG: hypothetical protein AAB440_00010 [Patescibacteria group bacterium]
MKTLALIIGVLFLAPVLVQAGHKSYVGSVLIESSDRGIYEAHDPNCASRHYHGTLNDVPDPAPDGCGHGEVKIIVHGDGDGESIPTPKKGAWETFTTWVGSWFPTEKAKNVVDVAAESNGLPPPFQTAELVDDVKNAAPSIKENVDNIKEYRESVSPEDDTLGIYNAPSSGGNADGSDTLSQKFFKWFNSLVP